MAAVHAVIFDLGGVLLNLAPDRTKQAFEALGVSNFDALFTVYQATPLFDQLETGHVEPSEFVQAMRRELPDGVSDQAIIDAWNAMLLDYRLDSLRFVESLKSVRPVYLFSNTNKIHYDWFQASAKHTTPYATLDDIFHKAYYSHDIGYRKPDAAGYRHILDEQGLEAATTLFVDDNAKNIEGAKATGLQVHWLQPGERVETVLGSLLNP